MLFADLTDMQRREAERRLSESLARLGELTAGVAHEMRNSLASLDGHLTLFARAASDEDRAASLGDLRHEVGHLQRVVDDFLSFARPGSARLEPIDLVAMLHRVAADPGLAAVEVQVEAPEEPVRVAGDRQLLERVLHNLAANAMQALEDRRPIRLRLKQGESTVAVEVLDRGPGIPARIADKVFDPFVSGRPGGTGLGLAIARRIVELHDGGLEVSPRPGGGTVATMTLPRRRP